MPLTSSGQIDLNAMHVEAGGTSGTECSLNDTDIRGMIDKASGAQMAFNEWYGASSTFSFTISSNTKQGNLNSLATAAGWDGSAALECTINSNVYVWSDSSSTAALIVNVAGAKVTNNGKIMGKGGQGGGEHQGNATGYSGGPALNITASSTTIVNNSGAFIAGGGGGGGTWYNENRHGDFFWTGGGGGAGGGYGGYGTYGGSNNRNGGSIGNASPRGSTAGGQYGGNRDHGHGGGRVLPGDQYVNGSLTSGGYWGSSGLSPLFSGGSGGAAITGTSRTLTNNGTIYGST